MEVQNKALVAFCLFLLISVAYLFYENTTLRKELYNKIAELNTTSFYLNQAEVQIGQLARLLGETKDELSQTKSLLFNTSTQLNATKNELQLTKAQLNETASLLNETIEKFILLKSEISALEESVNYSIQWFRNNALLPETLDYFFYTVDSECIKGKVLNLACVAYLMERKLYFSYKSEVPDRLLSLDEMVKNKGGDCEDYSLFVKALLNSMKNAKKVIELEAWEPSSGEYIVYKTGSTYWYVHGEPYYIGSLEDLNPYVVCYTTYHDGSRREGHCIVALFKKNISSVDDLKYMDGAVTFEPQNGMHMGEVGKHFHVCAEGNAHCETELNAISFIIADDDLYQFSNGSWKSYKLYQQSASVLENSIKSVIER